MAKIVIALGGNALGKTPSEQKVAVKITAGAITSLHQQGHNIVVVHGNGPQVGWINNAFMAAWKNQASPEVLPFPECGAMSQGYIGYHLQNAIQNDFLSKNLHGAKVITLVSQAIVDQNDPAFKKPTKPIGDFMEEAVAKKLAQKNNWVVKEDAGRGWRRVIASPQPIAFPALPIVETLLTKNVITIVGGGGGIPVFKQHQLEGVDAVIDKDLTAAFIAASLKADKLIILTAVDKVKINFGLPNEKALELLNLKALDKYEHENQFAPGSMLPKIRAVKAFVTKTKQNAYIGHLEDALKIINEAAGTKIVS